MSSDGEGATIPKARRGRKAKTPQAAAAEAPVADTKVTRRLKAEDSPDSEGLAPVTKTKTKRGAKAKVVEAVEENASAEEVAQSSELEEVAPVSSRGRRGRRGKTPVSQDGPSDDKENTGEHPTKPTGKKPGTRGRRAPVTTVSAEALDAPAKRTRSRK